MADTQDGPDLHPVTRELANGPNYAVLSTLLPSGRIQSQYIWVGVEGDRLYVNTEPHRRKFQNLEQDARLTLAIRDENDPYRYAEVRGHVAGTEAGQAARDQIDTLSQKYDGKPYPPDQIKTERVTVWIEPERQTIAG
jgi:PPOX class probable F420-dependent enzyme